MFFCKDVDGLMMKLGCEDKCDDGRLFIDLSKASLKVVLLPNGNTHRSMAVAHSVEETYETMKLSFNSLQYPKFSLKYCGNLKVVSLIFKKFGSHKSDA